MNPALGDGIRRRLGGHVEQRAIGVPVHLQDRVHQRHVGHPEAVQQDGDRVHQGVGLVGDDL